MSVTEIANALGEFNVTLKNTTPLEILNKIDYFGHIAITAARVDPESYGDNLFNDARYAGVVRSRSFGETNKKIGGAHLAFWLGDEDAKGEVIETPIEFLNASFTDVVNALLPDGLVAGNITNLSGLYNGIQVFQSPRQAIDYVFGFYNAEWRIRGKGVFDAGLISDLYVTTPKTAILRNRSGLEMNYRALPGAAKLDADVKDFTTRLLLLAEDADRTTISATADINPTLNPYLDLFGNPVKLTRIVVEQATAEGNASARAQLQLNRFTSPRDALTLSTAQYDIKGSVEAGDYVWVYDPDAKLTDPTNTIDFDGEYITPLKLRVFQLSWPIVKGMGVAYRTKTGEWIDLTDWVQYEQGNTSVVVGGYNRSLTGQGSITQDPGSGPTGNSTIPAAPTFLLPFKSGTYQSDVDGLTRADVIVAWTQPLNTDSSVITDGGYYEVRYRTGETSIYPSTHFDMSFFRHNQLTGLQNSPIPADEGPWNFIRVPWGTEEFRVQELTPGIPYDFQIRAFDNAVPVNISAWSAVTIVQTRPDTQAPSTPAAPDVAASKVAVQIISTLGKASGGEYNLEADLNHFKIHAGPDPSFTTINLSIPDGGTLLGKLPANIGMIKGHIPAVGTFQVTATTAKWYKIVAVDNFGNESRPSIAVQQTAELWDSVHISELTVSKVSAGTIFADWVQAAIMSTSATGVGNRVDIAYYGIEAFDDLNRKTFDLESATGSFTAVGTFLAKDYDNPGDEIAISASVAAGGSGLSFPTITFTDNNASWPGYAYINALAAFGSGGTALGLNSGPSAASSPQNQSSLILSDSAWRVQYNTLSPTPNLLRGARAYGDLTALDLDFFDASGDLKSRSFFNDEYALVQYFSGAGVLRSQLDLTLNSAALRYFDSTVERSRVYIDDDEAGVIAFTSGGAVRSWGIADQAGFAIGTNGVEAARSTTGSGGFYFTAVRYCSNGENQFQGQVQGGSAGDVFSMRNGGGGDPILDMDGFAARFVKNFVIDHPIDPDNKWLAHCTTETPVPGLEYSGEVEIHDYQAQVQLPSYFEAIAHEEDRQVFVDVQLPRDGSMYPYIPRAIASTPEYGRFRISSDGINGTRVVWRVFAKRKDVTFEVEPLKSKFDRGGEPPYTYLVEK